ncbi:MAG: hypothetical protein KAI86_10230 [Desulfobacterales bacterium]|nr:hypothetical protein [Desulfobacterales bacterium]
MAYRAVVYDGDGFFQGITFGDNYEAEHIPEKPNEVEKECLKIVEQARETEQRYLKRAAMLSGYGEIRVAEAIKRNHWLAQFTQNIDIYFKARRGGDYGRHGKAIVEKGFKRLLEEYRWAEDQVTDDQCKIYAEWEAT